jgi:hypothetical protein
MKEATTKKTTTTKLYKNKLKATIQNCYGKKMSRNK